MLLKSEWATGFINSCMMVRSIRRRSFAAGQAIYLGTPAGRCWVVRSGYVKLIDPRKEGNRFIRLVLGRGSLFGDLPFGAAAFRRFASPQQEQALAHGPAEVLEIERAELEAATIARADLAIQLLESVTTRALFLERRLLWQITTPIRSRIAAALRDLICFEGRRCKHGHAIDIRLTHEDLAEIVGSARPVVSAEVARLRSEKLLSRTKFYFCVDDLNGLNRVAEE